MKYLIIALFAGTCLNAQDSTGAYVFAAKDGAKLRDGSNYNSSILKVLHEGEHLDIDPEYYEEGYLKACAGEMCGFISDLWIKWDDNFKNFRRAYQDQKKEARYAAAEKAFENFREKEKEHIAQNGQSTYNRLKTGNVWIGLTEEMTVIAWGRPKKVNSTSGSWGTHDQWVYESGSYLYFEIGKLTSIQK
jgi:hypothetical protein